MSTNKLNTAVHNTQKVMKPGVAERTIEDINNALEQSLFAETIARRDGLLQRIDPRVKILALLLLLFAVNFAHRLDVIITFYFFAVLLAILSRVPIIFYLKRTWIFVLVFTGIVALPALFLTPGPALLHLTPGIVITQTGAQTALFLLLRVVTSVSLAVLLIITTPWNNVLKALGVLRLPDVVLITLLMTYRYIHLLLHLASDMFLSRKSRILHPLRGAEERRMVAASTGILMGKSLQLSGEVYLAMESRGFRDYPRTMNRFQLRLPDAIAGFVTILIFTAAVWFGR